MSHLEHGRCGACTRPATRFPSGNWEHDGRPCAMRGYVVHRVDDVPVRKLLVFVPDGDELPQPLGWRAGDKALLAQRFPQIDWDQHFARPSHWDTVRERLAADAQVAS